MGELENSIKISENEILKRRREKSIAEIEDKYCKTCSESLSYCNNKCEYFKCLCGLNQGISELEEENKKMIEESIAKDEVQDC